MKLVIAALALLTCAAPLSGQSPAESAAPAAPGSSTRAAGWRLAAASSPYLREHADNPVEWFPWGDEAFARARELQRPIFLSIGYSACHWCHRMERDTFEDAECARLLNEHFVSIKVDREERPDIDSRYMQALEVITGNGGWPASLFLTSDGMAFAGGTYFAPEDTQESAGFRKLLVTISGLWDTQRDTIVASGKELNDALLRDPLSAVFGPDVSPPAQAAPDQAPGEPAADQPAGAPSAQPVAGQAAAASPPALPAAELAALVDKGLIELTSSLDSEHGGTFGVPKFPPPMTLSFLLRQHLRSGVDVLPLVRTSLDAMAGGALQDPVGGGFHRYCLDAEWKLPHFEKMLGDNALLGLAYAEAFAVTGEAEYADVARRTLRFVARSLRTPDGLFASSLDADSLPFDEHGAPLPGARVEEGCAYLWTLAELHAALGEQDGARFAALFGATAEGNVAAGRSILRPMRTRTALALATAAGEVPDWPDDAPRGAQLGAWLDDCLARLAAARGRRPQPARDDKCLAAQNGLALSAFARSGALLQDTELRGLARELAALVKSGLMPGGPASLHHQLFGSVASGEPDLLDHAAIARGLLDAASALGASDLLPDALALGHQLLDRFEDPQGGLYDTTGSDPHLPGRGRDVWDEALPSGTSVALEVLLRLAPLDDSGRLGAAAQRAIVRLAPLAAATPQGFAALFGALDIARGPLLEVVVDGSGPGFDAMLTEVGRTLLPAALVVPHTTLTASMLELAGGRAPSLLEDRIAPDGEARAWVCVRRACLLPATTVEELAAQLKTAGKR